MAGMARLGPGAFVASPAPRMGVGLRIDWNHGGRRGRRRRRSTAVGPPLQFGDASRGGQQRQRHRLGAERVELTRRSLIADAGLQNVTGRPKTSRV